MKATNRVQPVNNILYQCKDRSGFMKVIVYVNGKNVKDMTPEEKRETSIKLNNQILFPMGYRLKENKPDNRT